MYSHSKLMNYSYNKIAEIFSINYPEDNNNNKVFTYSSKCNDNRCILMQDNLGDSFQISYLCNFDSEYY